MTTLEIRKRGRPFEELTGLDQDLLQVLEDAGGEAPSKVALCFRVGSDYKNAATRLKYLISRGYVKTVIERSRGHPHRVILISRRPRR